MICKKCSSNIPDTAKFCPKCGAKVEAVKTQETKKCPSCGAENSIDAKFCRVDGYNFQQAVETQSKNLDIETTAQQEIVVSQAKAEVREEVVRKPSKTWIWVTVLALILVIAGTGGYIYFSGLTGKKASVMTDVPETLPKSTEKATSYEDTSEKIAPKMEDTEINKDVVLALEPFVVNLSDPTGARFLKVSLKLELANPAATATAMAKTYQIRDAIINILTSKTSDMLISPEGKLQLKNEINIRLNQIAGENSVKNIYFVDFVMQ